MDIVRNKIQEMAARVFKIHPNLVPHSIWRPTFLEAGMCSILLRTANFYLTSLQMKLKRDRVLGYPSYLFVDVTNVCNLKCPLCATGSGAYGQGKGDDVP